MENIATRTRKSATKSICLVLITLMLFCLLATGCRQTHNEDPKDNDNGPNNGLPTNVPTDSNGTMLFSISSVNIFAQSNESEKELYLDETNELSCSTGFDYEDDTIISDIFQNKKLNDDSNRIEL